MKSIRISSFFYFITGGITIIILYAPLILVFIFSFNSANRGMIWEEFTIRWYKDVWSDSLLISSLANSLKVTFLTCLLSVFGGLSCGYLLSVSKKRTFIILSTILFLPIITPDLIASLSHSLFYQAIGIKKGIFTISLSLSYFGIAYIGLFISARLRAFGFQQYIIASSSLGASPFRTLYDIFIPLAFPAAAAGTCVVAALCIQDFLFAFFCGGKGATTLSVKLYSMIKFGINPGINVIYVLMIIITISTFAIIKHYFNKEENL